MKKFILILMIAQQILFAQEEAFQTEVYIENKPKSLNIDIVSENLATIINSITKSYFENAISPKLSTSNISEEGINNIIQLWKYRKFRINEAELYLNVIELKEAKNDKKTLVTTGFEVRNISFIQLDDEGSSVYQNGIFKIALDGRITDLKFGLEEEEYKNIISRGLSAIEEARRLVILNFVENFRTAYCKKDINYISQVFAEKAIIIVGKVIKETDNGITLKGNVENSKVEYIKYSKDQYITNLIRNFKNNKYIKILFDSINIAQHRVNTNFYGVQLVQKWKSTNYQDEGFLFLLIDFTNEEEPLIHVRAWEPIKNHPDPKQKIALGDFDLD